MKHGLKIAHYAPQIWANGGISNYVRRLGTAQMEAGFEVTYLTRKESDAPENPDAVVVKNDRQLFDRARELGIDILHLHKPVRFLPEERVTTVRTMHGNQGSCPSGSRYLVRSERPCERLYSVSGCLATHLTQRCGSLRPKKLKRNFTGIVNEHKLGEKIHTYTVSRFLREWMLKTGYREQRLHVLNSPAPDVSPIKAPSPDESTPHFLFLGRLVPHKGAQWLLRALRHVKKPVKIDIGGTGPMQKSLQAYCQRHGLHHKVNFHGWLNQNQVRHLMASARAVIVPSIWQEPAGLVTLEAAAAGRAVIASRSGGIPEYALEDYSLLVTPNDAGQLADAIEKLAGDFELAKKMGESGMKAAQSQFAMSGFLQRQLELYTQALDEKNIQLIGSH